MMDDMMEKQYGRGTLYYGKRKVAEEEEPVNEDEYEILKPDPVLVAGGTGRTGQWVVLGLLNQGFNVRVLTRKFENAEKLFGDSGINVDVFEGALDDPEALAEAMDGTKAVVFVAGGEQILFIRKSPPSAEFLVKAAIDAKVERFVLVTEKNHQDASERMLHETEMPHMVVKPNRLTDDEGGLKTVELETSSNQDKSQSGAICRLDLAQVLCQVLVHDRFIDGMKETDPDGGFDFPNATVQVSNGTEEFVPSDRYWSSKFNALSKSESDS